MEKPQLQHVSYWMLFIHHNCTSSFGFGDPSKLWKLCLLIFATFKDEINLLFRGQMDAVLCTSIWAARTNPSVSIVVSETHWGFKQRCQLCQAGNEKVRTSLDIIWQHVHSSVCEYFVKLFFVVEFCVLYLYIRAAQFLLQ